jgi:hypothetical protein
MFHESVLGLKQMSPSTKNATYAVVVVILTICTSCNVLADDFYRKKIAQWGDPLTPPHTRTRCVKNSSMTGFKCRGLKCSRATWTTCTGWATDTQTMQCELFLRVPKPNSLAPAAFAAAKNVAAVCAAVALSTVSAASLQSAGAALAALQPVFVGCVQSRGGQALASLTVTVDQSCGWSKWSNE